MNTQTVAAADPACKRSVAVGEADPNSLGRIGPEHERSAGLTPAQIDRFHAEGYLSLKGALDPQELLRLAPLIERLFAERTGFSEGDLFDFVGHDDNNPMLPQMLRPSAYEPALKQSSALRDCLAMASQL